MKKWSRRDVLRVTSGVGLAAVRSANAQQLGVRQEISSAAGLRVSLSLNGAYELTASPFGWTFGGSLGRPVRNLNIRYGGDVTGTWQEITFDYDPARSAAIRLYDRKALVLFTIQYNADAPNDDSFPRFTSYPQGLFNFSYSTLWASRFGTLNIRSPWVFFDSHANAVLISPASNFMTAVTNLASDGAIEPIIDRRIPSLPAGFVHRSMLTFAPGINAAFELWGRT